MILSYVNLFVIYMKKAIIWARVSSQEQANEGHSIETQLKNNREYCKNNGLTIVKEFEVVESSKTSNRPKFYEMMTFIEKQNEKIHIITQASDRLHRDYEAFALIDSLKDAGKIIVHFTRNNEIYDQNSDDIKYHLDQVISKHEIKKLGKRVKTVLQSKLEKGENIRRLPVGYLKVKDHITGIQNTILDPVRAPLIKKMFEMYSLGSYSLGDLEKFAKEYNLTNTFYAGSTQTLSKNVISSTLKDPFYYGEMLVKSHGDKLYPHKYDKLITKELFDECQRVNSGRCKENNRDKAVQTAKEGKDFVFRSLITCASSGRTATTDEKLDDRGYINNYLIVRNPEDIKKKVYVREKDVLVEVSNVFAKIKFPNEMLEIITENLKKTHDFEQEHYQIKLNDIESRIKSEEQKQNRLLDALLNGSITQPIFANKKSEIEQTIANLERERAMYKSADKNFKNAVITAFQLASRLHDIFLVSKNCEKREIINFVFSKLELTGKTLGYTLRCPFDLMLENAGCDTWLPE